MRVLFIDDNRLVESTDPDTELVVARTNQEAANLLTQGRWDEVFFDHDMWDQPNVSLRESTRPLAMWLVENQHRVDIGTIFVHTASNDGAKWLMRVLREVKGVPVRRWNRNQAE